MFNFLSGDNDELLWFLIVFLLLFNGNKGKKHCGHHGNVGMVDSITD